MVGPNKSSAHAGSDISSGGSGTLVAPAFCRAAIQIKIFLRDIKYRRRSLLVRARLTRSIDPSSEKIKNRMSKGSDNMFCSRPWTLRLNPVRLVLARFGIEAFPEAEVTAFSSLRRFGMRSVTSKSSSRSVLSSLSSSS